MTKQIFARIGIASKGIVFLFIALLALFAAIGSGGQKTGTRGALRYVAEQPFGQLFLLILGIGLTGYVLWRWYQFYHDVNRYGKSFLGILNRIGFLFSGLFYGYLAFYAVKLALAIGYDDHKKSVDDLLSSENGTLITIIIGLIIIGKAIFEFYLVYSKLYRLDIETSDKNKASNDVLYRWGQFGFISRGLVFGMMGYMTVKTGLAARTNVLNTKTKAMEQFEIEFGSTLFFLLAFGLLGYAVFMFIKAKHIKLYFN